MSCFLLYPISTDKLICLSRDDILDIIEQYNQTSFPVMFGDFQFTIKDIHILQKFIVNSEDLEEFFNAIHFGVEDIVQEYISKNSNVCNTFSNGDYALKIAHEQLKKNFLDIRYNNIYRMVWNCSDPSIRSRFKVRNDTRRKIKVQRYKKVRKYQPLAEEDAEDIFNRAVADVATDVAKDVGVVTGTHVPPLVSQEPVGQLYDTSCNNNIDTYTNEVLDNPPVDVYNISGNCIVEENLFKYFSGNLELQNFISQEKEKHSSLFNEIEKLKTLNGVYKIPFYKKAVVKAIAYKAKDKIATSVFNSLEKGMLNDIVSELNNIDYITQDLISKMCDVTIQLYFAQKRRAVANSSGEKIDLVKLLSQLYDFIKNL